jgi:hypothetical protein
MSVDPVQPRGHCEAGIGSDHCGPAAPLAAAVHDGMPVIIDPDDSDRRLSPATPVEELRGLLKRFPANSTGKRLTEATAGDRMKISIDELGHPDAREARPPWSAGGSGRCRDQCRNILSS